MFLQLRRALLGQRSRRRAARGACVVRRSNERQPGQWRAPHALSQLVEHGGERGLDLGLPRVEAEFAWHLNAHRPVSGLRDAHWCTGEQRLQRLAFGRQRRGGSGTLVGSRWGWCRCRCWCRWGRWGRGRRGLGVGLDRLAWRRRRLDASTAREGQCNHQRTGRKHRARKSQEERKTHVARQSHLYVREAISGPVRRCGRRTRARLTTDQPAAQSSATRQPRRHAGRTRCA